MNDFLDQLRSGFTGLAEPGQGLVLAVSGGRDSMALLHGAAQLSRSSGHAGIVVAHLNHGLRGESGRSDAELVRATSERLGLPVVISECTAGELLASSRGSLEESARNARYEFLCQTAVAHGMPLVATAHHAGDQVETVLHNILRGTGLRGLRGIPERRSIAGTVSLIRPMLTISPDTIARFVAEQHVPFAEDATNVDLKFTRNRLREELLPAMRAGFNSQVDAALIRLSRQTGELIHCVDALADQILDRALLEQAPAICRLDRETLRESPEPLIRHAMTLLWSRCEWPRQGMTSELWQRLSGIVLQGGEQSLDLPGRLRLSCGGAIVRIERSSQAQRASE